MQPEMSQAEYARHRGVSRQAISKLVRAKKIPVLANGKISPAHADDALGDTQERVVIRETPAARSAGADSGLSKARAADAFYSAQRSKLKYERELGQLVPTNDVGAAAAACNAALVQSIERIPARAEDIISAAAKEGIVGVRAVLKDIARDVRRNASDAFAKLVADAMSAAEAEEAEQESEEAAL